MYLQKEKIRLLTIAILGSSSFAAFAEDLVPIKQMDVISEATESVLQEKKMVNGVVLDEQGTPIIGANVFVKGTTNGTITDMDGKFSLEVPVSAVLSVTYVGYVEQHIRVSEGKSLIIRMKEDTETLDEVVVVGYGTTSVRKNTTSLAIVDNEKVLEVPFSDMGSTLQGRVPGVIVQQGSAEPGQNGASISIRGNGTPLYVIDGFVSTQARFQALNKADIESMTVLKDAASTAVYGMNAGNGVIVVKTKQGQAGKLNVNYQANFAFNAPSYLSERMDAYEYATAINKLNQNLGYGVNSFRNPEQMAEIAANLNSYTNWENTFLRSSAPQNEHTVSVSGGTEKLKFFGSLNYLGQKGIYKSDKLNYDRYNYRTNISSHFDEIGLTVGLNVNGTIRDELYPSASAYTLFSCLRDRNPFEKPYNEDGTISNQFDNPALQLDGPGEIKYRTVYNQLAVNLEWAVPGVKGLTLGFDGNYNIETRDRSDWYENATYYDDEGNATYENPSNISLSRSSYQYNRYDYNIRADYKNTFADKHNLLVTLVHNRQWYHGTSLTAGSNTFYLSNIHQIQNGDASSITASNSESEQASMGYVGRFRYDYDNRYMIELSGRYDGSDCFPKGNRFGFFPSGSIGWTISEESFFTPIKDLGIFNYLKVRGSYGEIGINGANHDQYAYMTTYNYNSNAYVIDGKLVNSITPGATPSINMTWYTRRKTDIGIDFSTLNERLEGSFDWFYENTKGFLVSPNYEYTDPIGYDLPMIVSDAEDRSEGLDGYLKYTDKIGEVDFSIGTNFTWYHSIAYKTNEDKVTLSNPYTRAQGYLYGYLTTGYIGTKFYQTPEDILNNPKRINAKDLRPGDLWYYDANGDGQITGQDQRKFGDNANPKFVFGVDLSASWKGLSILANIQGTGRRQTYMSNIVMAQEGERRLDFVYQLDTWTPTNTDANYPRAGNTSLNENNNYQTSDFWARNTNYVRLKSLTISYDLKYSLLKRLDWLNNLTLFASGVNLFAIGPSIKYGDPEASNFDGYAYPMMRTYSFGFQVGF